MSELEQLNSDPSKSGAPRYGQLVVWATLLWAGDTGLGYLVGSSSIDGTWVASTIGVLYTLVVGFVLVFVLSRRHGLFGKNSYRVARDVMIMFAIGFGISSVLDPMVLILSLG